MSTEKLSGLRIGVLDNDVFALDAVARIIRAASRNEAEVWATAFPTEAMQRCMNSTEPTQVLFIDMALRGMTGPQIAARIHAQDPRIRLVGMTSYDPDAYRKAAAAAGVLTVVDKATLKDAVPMVLAGIVSMREETFTAQDSSVTRKPLTATEQRVVALTFGGLSTKQIGSAMHISVDTVSSHRRNIKGKLCVDTWLEALDVCRELHIV